MMSVMADKFFGVKEKEPVQYGQFVVVDRNPSKEVVREAKKMMIESIKRTQDELKKKPFQIRILIYPEWEFIDPVTGEVVVAGTVGWKARFK